MYQGRNLRASEIGEGFVELCFDRSGEPINKFDARTVAELKEAVSAIAAAPHVKGVLATSAKDVFIVGADITEFGEKFRLPHADLVEDVRLSNEAFVALEDLALPTVVAVDGYALGGGFEFVLACALRAMSRKAQVGLPEVKLGLFPGFGGTVRLPRVAGAQAAVQWVADGQARGAEAALAVGAVDAVCDSEALRDTALEMLRRAAAGEIDWRAAQQRKRQPHTNGHAEALLDGFAEWRVSVAAASGPHQPAALAAVDLMARAAALDRDAALALESEAFARIARTQAAAALVQTFLSDQVVRKIARRRTQGARPPRRVVVLGAGIPGHEVAGASGGIPVLDEADLVIDTRGANPDTQGQVLAKTEAALRPDAVLAINPAGLCIDDIARGLQHPERLVGMRFFHAVPAMPLVEVVQGSASSDAAIASAVAHAHALKMTPVVVKDGRGFLVQRVLMAYTGAARRLVTDGGDPIAIDRAMEAFGWPEGPFGLSQKLGIDTGSFTDANAAGHPQRVPQTLAVPPDGPRGFSDEDIVDRLMMPFIIEAAHALADGVVATPAELDVALLLALGCPAYTGGPLQYADWLGLDEVVRRCDALRSLGALYEPTPRMRQMAAAGGTFHEQGSFR